MRSHYFLRAQRALNMRLDQKNLASKFLSYLGLIHTKASQVLTAKQIRYSDTLAITELNRYSELLLCRV
jgi:hypothetical protein